MGTATHARLLRLILGMPRLVLKVLQQSFAGRALRKVLFQLASVASALRLKLVSMKTGSGVTSKRPSAPCGESTLVTRPKAPGFFDFHPSPDGYVQVADGDTITLDDTVAFSSYPSSSAPSNGFSTSWTHLHFRPQTETRLSEALSASTVIEYNEASSRWESNVTSTLILSQAGVAGTYLSHPRIKPIMPEESRRYKQQSAGEHDSSKATAWAKYPLSFGWSQCAHPEGGVYFTHKEKRIYTDADLYDTAIFQQALEDISTIEGFLSKNNINLPKNCDLILDVSYNNAHQEIETVYYFAHHPSRSIFFLDNFEASWCNRKGINSSLHLSEELESQYWLYLQLYPQAMEMSATLVSELRDMVLYFIKDYMSSQKSAMVYSLDELHRMLTIADTLEKNIGHQSSGAVALISQIMHTFAHSRVYNSNGEIQTRLKNETTIYGIQNFKRTWFLRGASTLLFSAPNFYFRTLRRMWVIGGTHSSVWDQGVTRLRHEWRELVFWSTLLLIANAAFLGIHDVGLRHEALRHRSGAQISSYISGFFNIGSILLGLLYHRHIMGVSVGSIGSTDPTKQTRFLEVRAVLYSLPYVFLLWAVIAFATAFSFLCFQDTSKVTRIIVGTFSAAITVIVIFGIIFTWETYTEQDPPESRPATPDEKSPQKAATSQV